MNCLEKTITEQQICCAIKDFCDIYFLPMFHIANEGHRSRFAGHMLKRIGMLPGVSDYFFMHETHKGMFLEVKTITGKPTKPQLRFLELVNSLGYYGTIGYGLDACLSEIRRFYDIQ